ncbi:MAG: glutamyl-tRNA reductase, partial [Nitrospirae bacterium]
DNVYLYDIDDLQGVVDSNVKARKNEAERAEFIVEEEVSSFLKWYETIDVTPTIIALRKRAEDIRMAELHKAMKRLNGSIGERDFKTIEAMTKAIVNKLIHPPTILLKNDRDNRDDAIALIRKLYGIDREGENGE